MEIEITVRHADVTEAVKSHAMEKLRKIGEEFPQMTHVHVILDVERYLQVAEIVAEGKKFVRMEAKESSADMYASIDTAVDKIERRLRRQLDKRQNHKGRPSVSTVEGTLAEDGEA